MATKLPPGRHGIPRKTVRANQRERILMATAEEARKRGFIDLTVEDIVYLAKVSRRTFYELYRDKAEAFVDAHEAGLLRTQVKPETLAPYIGPRLAKRVAG